MFQIWGRDTNGEYTVLSSVVEGDSVRLIASFVPNLFSKIQVSKHGQISDIIDYPSQTLTVVNTCIISKPEANYYDQFGLETSKWIIFISVEAPPLGFCSNYMETRVKI